MTRRLVDRITRRSVLGRVGPDRVERCARLRVDRAGVRRFLSEFGSRLIAGGFEQVRLAIPRRERRHGQHIAVPVKAK